MRNYRYLLVLCVLVFVGCSENPAQNFDEENFASKTGLISMMSDLYTGEYQGKSLWKIRELQLEEIKKRKADFLKTLPQCVKEVSNPTLEPQKLDPLLVNCKKVKKEGNLISGIGGIDPIFEILNGTYSMINRSEVYSSALCSEEGGFRETSSESAKMYYKWENPLTARLKNNIVGKGLINELNLYNSEIGDLSMYGGKPFSKTAPMGYGENNGHYYLIGRKNIPIGTNIFRTEKVYVIDDQVYAAGERLYLDTMRETVKQSERDLEGLSGDVVIFKRMTNGQFKKGIGDPFDYQMDHGSAMTYQLETCELPLLKNPDFISYMGENKVNPLLTYQYQRENVQIETDPLPCEGTGYFDRLKKTDAIYHLPYDPQTATYRKYIPELCAVVSTSPLFLDRVFYDDVGDEIVLERKGNMLYNPVFYNKKPILIFENKERNQNLDLVLHKSAKKADPTCQLIEHESEHYQAWAYNQAKAYAFIAPFVREGWRDQLPCINKYEEDIGGDYPMAEYDYYILADVRYPGMFVYAIDQRGNKHLGNNLTIFLGEKR